MTQPTERRFVMEPRLDAEVQALEAVDATKAPLASPALTGTPTGPTAAVDTSTTQLATTAFVTNQAAAATSPMDGTAAVGTSKRYARQDHVHPTDTTRAPLASPTFTGTPAAPTAAADTNTTQVATTAYVVGQASSTSPVMDGTAAAGTSLKYARADHVHPTDTSRAPAAGSSSITTVGTIASGTWQGTDVALAYGGTNATLTAANGGVVYSNATAMAITAAGTQDQVLKSNGAAAPTWQTLDLTYMPDAAYKKSVRAATTANITLSAPQTIDGISVVAGDRVLVKNQTAAAENGIYIVQAAAWTRATDADTISEIAGATVNVDSGTQGSQLWSNNLKTTDTLGTTAMVWTRLLNTGDVGSSVQAYNATLAAVAGGTYTGDDSIATVGTITAGTWNATDISLAAGGTNATLTAVNGGVVYSNATAMAITAAGTTGQVLKSNGAAAPTWQTNNLDSLSDVVITSPTAGQTLAYNGTNWINGSGGGGGVTASATAPASPVNGSAWFDTNDGTLYVYYTDANSSQWVEVQADSALGSQLTTRMSTAESNITALQSASPNYVLNADFSINQRGFTSTTTNGAYGFDRWHMAALSGATYSAQTFTPGAAPVTGYEGKNYARLVTSGQTGANMYTILRQPIEDVRLIAGKTVTISFWAKAASGTPRVAVELEQNFGTGGTPSAAVTVNAGQVTLSTSWARYSVTVAVPSLSGKTLGTTDNTSNTMLSLFVSAGTDYNSRTGSLGIQSNTFDFWGVQVEHGAVATGFRRNTANLQAELAACQRYFQAFQGSVVGSSPPSYLAYKYFFVPSTVQMRVLPTASASSLRDSYTGGTLGSNPTMSVDGQGYVWTQSGANSTSGWNNILGLQLSAEL